MVELSDRVKKAVNDESELEQLLKDYNGFIASCAYNATGKYVSNHDDEMSIAICAFAEAVKRYQSDKGDFLAFAKNMIKWRVIDYARKDRKNENLIQFSLDEDQDEDNDKQPFQLKSSDQVSVIDPVRLEIEELSQTLTEYGFGFMDLAKASPKSKKTKTHCAELIRYILREEPVMDEIRKTKQLPIASINKKCTVPRKTIERHRKYILCAVEILRGDYPYLAEYMRFIKEVEEQ